MDYESLVLGQTKDNNQGEEDYLQKGETHVQDQEEYQTEVEPNKQTHLLPVDDQYDREQK